MTLATLSLAPVYAAPALLMVVGGAALIFSVRRRRRDVASGRIGLIAPSGAVGGSPLASPLPTASTTLARAPTGGMTAGQQRELNKMFSLVGLPARYGPVAYPWFRFGAVAVLGLLGLVLVHGIFPKAPVAAWLLGAAICAAVGWLAPNMVLGHFTKRHASDSAEGLPDALELLIVCVEAGLSLEDSIDRIIVDLRWSRPALAEELMLTSADLKILPDRDQALANLATRIDVPSVRSVVTSLSQTLRYGTPLAQALKVTAAELRNDALVRMEEKATGLPTLLTLPMMLFIMPTIFMIILGPAVLRIMDLFKHK
jgi:tight adherence protein C